MKPYYEHAGISIYHGDCREILPQVGVWCWDVFLTDPPYGIGLSNHAAGKERRESSFAIHGDSTAEMGQWVADWVTVKKLPLLMFASPFNPFNGDWRNLCVWDKGPAVGGGGDTATCFKRTWELIQIARNRPLNGERDSSVLAYWITPQDSLLHVAQKPLALMKYLISKMTHEDNRVIDPFMGSGTTLEAAKNLGRSAIGIEIEEKYCEIAAKRLSQEVFQFGEEIR